MEPIAEKFLTWLGLGVTVLFGGLALTGRVTRRLGLSVSLIGGLIALYGLLGLVTGRDALRVAVDALHLAGWRWVSFGIVFLVSTVGLILMAREIQLLNAAVAAAKAAEAEAVAAASAAKAETSEATKRWVRYCIAIDIVSHYREMKATQSLAERKQLLHSISGLMDVIENNLDEEQRSFHHPLSAAKRDIHTAIIEDWSIEKIETPINGVAKQFNLGRLV